MGLKWIDIPPKVRNQLETELLLTRANEKGNDFSNNSFTMLLRGCTLMKYRWQFTSEIGDVIFSLFCQTFTPANERWSPSQLASCISDIGEVGIKWIKLPKEAQETILQGMEARSGSFNSLSALFYG
jgi:hypothetical protein